MYAVWTARPTWLFDIALHGSLAALGVRRLQLNVDDEHVAGARLRLSTSNDPIRVVASAWTDGDPEHVTRELSARAERLAGWVVQERVPIPPPPSTGNGRRAEALANVALLRIPPGMDRQAWRQRWIEVHTGVAMELQATFGYVQNEVVEPLGEEECPVAALVEELFPMAALSDLHAFYGSGGDDEELRRRMRRMAESTATFGASTNLDLVPTSRYLLELDDNKAVGAQTTPDSDQDEYR